MAEGFRPVSNTPPISFTGKLKFYGRMILDLQILTIYRDIKKTIPYFTGNVLDIGAGQSPYKHLLNAQQTKYYGIDIVDAEKFDYNNSDITPFNGEDVPFENEMFDGVICTEVLEHVQNYQKLINEMHRVMKKGATAIITIPWSARYHYIPYDFFRISNRGTDITTIGNKVIVVWFRNLLPSNPIKWILVPIWIVLSMPLSLFVLLVHVSLWLNLGSDNDPLGYTIVVKK